MADRPDARHCDPCLLLTPALEIAIEAGRAIQEIYEGGFQVEQKEDHTPLTEADLAADRIIAHGLRELTPQLPVLTEESTAIPFAERSTWHRYWLVDPLDGTREFINRSGEFTVNIALIEAHEPVLGIIYAPALGIYYYACRGQGAYKREATNEPQRLKVRRWEKGKVTLVCSSATHRGKYLQKLMDRLGEYDANPAWWRRARQISMPGSAPLRSGILPPPSASLRRRADALPTRRCTPCATTPRIHYSIHIFLSSARPTKTGQHTCKRLAYLRVS